MWFIIIFSSTINIHFQTKKSTVVEKTSFDFLWWKNPVVTLCLMWKKARDKRSGLAQWFNKVSRKRQSLPAILKFGSTSKNRDGNCISRHLTIVPEKRGNELVERSYHQGPIPICHWPEMCHIFTVSSNRKSLEYWLGSNLIFQSREGQGRMRLNEEL